MGIADAEVELEEVVATEDVVKIDADIVELTADEPVELDGTNE